MKKSIILALILAGVLGLMGRYWAVEKAAKESLAKELREEKALLANTLDNLTRASDLTAVHKTENLKLQAAIDAQAAEIAGLKNELLGRMTEQEQHKTALGSMEKMLAAARTENEEYKLEAARAADQAARDRQAKLEAERRLANAANELEQLRSAYDQLTISWPGNSQPPPLSQPPDPNAAQIAEAAALKVEAAKTRGELNQLRLQLARDYAALAELKKELALLAQAKEPKAGPPQTIGEAYELLAQNMAGLIENQEAALAVRDKSLRLTMTGAAMFSPGRAELTPEGQRHLEALISALDGLPGLNVTIIGHTDNQPPSGSRNRNQPSSWELSAARAGAVAKYLADSGQLNIGRLEAAGRAFNEPVASNDTPEGRRRNNRMELIINEL